MFHKPGVEHGHRSVPPESKQAGTVKSLENQKFIAELIEARRVALPTYCTAFLRPPCQAAANVSRFSLEFHDLIMIKITQLLTYTTPMRLGRPASGLCITTAGIIDL